MLEMYAFLTKAEYETLTQILNKYIDYAGDLFCSKCNEVKYELDDKVCGLDLWKTEEFNYSEIKIGNTCIKDDILTCIYNNTIHRFKLVNRKADKGDLAYITGHSLAEDKYIGHCFKVDSRTDNGGWTEECALIRVSDAEHQGWCLYDNQYLVLEEITECV